MRQIEMQALVRAAVAVLAMSWLGGCNYLGPAAYLTMGLPKTPAAYELIDQPTLIFVDDRSNAIPQRATEVRKAIANTASVDLMKEEILTDTISSVDAMALARQRDRNDELLSIEQIGEASGAVQVIYVEMVSFKGSPDGVLPRPTSTFRLKVLDIVNKVRLFPAPDTDNEWHEVTVISPTVSPEQYRTTSGRRQIEKALALLTGERVAKVFYEHVDDDIGTRLGRE